ncbi:MAG: hypothetical protein GXY83_26775 [Rhodopirellula sp.]|nr:hypothetical protein [Rhodopirellula sp.]
MRLASCSAMLVGIAFFLNASPAQSEELTADDYIQFWSPLEGSWETTIESQGKAIPGQWKGWLSPIKKCYVVHGEDGGYSPVYSVDGYDPVAKKWTATGFDADGSFFLATHEIVGMKKGKRLENGATTKGERKLFKTDGTTTTITLTAVCDECSKNRIVILFTDQKENGQPRPDEKWICERSSDNKLWDAYRDLAAGTWLGTGTIAGDLDEFGLAKGDQFTFRLAKKLAGKGSSLVGEGDFRIDGKDYTATMRTLEGWDPETRQIRLLAFWSGGLVEEILLSRREGSAFLGTYIAKLPGREADRAGLSLAYPDRDSCVLKFLDGPRKGETLSSWKREK